MIKRGDVVKFTKGKWNNLLGIVDSVKEYDNETYYEIKVPTTTHTLTDVTSLKSEKEFIYIGECKNKNML